jgi:hypothetical protein
MSGPPKPRKIVAAIGHRDAPLDDRRPVGLPVRPRASGPEGHREGHVHTVVRHAEDREERRDEELARG